MGLRTDTRQRMVASAALLLREHGVAGTSVAKVLAHSNGPRGSVGFHFPGGRRELITDALTWAGETVTGNLRDAVTAGVGPERVFAAICQHYRTQLVDTDFAAGCPVGAAMQEAHHDADLAPVVSGIVADWQGALAALLVSAGHAEREADDLAVLAISSLEGAIMMARVTRSAAPIDVVVDRIAPLLAGE
ncbi:TetR/AcrR family transcriptional regulator [Nocardioides sp. NPDC057577]|uniref:TetR/AcrR family transcriptional regulator n=1 Tax=unclassified Nocardioides TaxID=2615069 RepID=UPI003647EDBE